MESLLFDLFTLPFFFCFRCRIDRGRLSGSESDSDSDLLAGFGINCGVLAASFFLSLFSYSVLFIKKRD